MPRCVLEQSPLAPLKNDGCIELFKISTACLRACSAGLCGQASVLVASLLHVTDWCVLVLGIC